MKMLRYLVALSSALSASALALHAQFTQSVPPPSAIEFIMVSREGLYNQTDASTVLPNSMNPVRFSVSVEGYGLTSTSPLTGASFTWPSGSSTPLTFDTWDNDWNFEDNSFATMAALNAAYGTGTYNISLTGTPTATVGITVGSFASSTLQVPVLTLTGGTWMGNAYVLGESDSLSITFNSVYSGTVASDQGFHYDAWLSDGMSSNEMNGFINYDPTSSSSVPGGSTPGDWVVGILPLGMYSLEVGYTDIQNGVPALTNSFSASLLEYRTNVQVIVVPEPSTYALMACGIGLLGLARWRRRHA